MKRYFNPLKPDSARIVYQLLPMEYADPNVPPDPIKMEIEIKDKDNVLVYGPRDLTYDEQKYQVLFWNGRDNSGQVVDMERGPFTADLKLQYRAGRELPGWVLRTVADLTAMSLEIDTIICPNDDTSFTYAPVDFPEERRIRSIAKINPVFMHWLLRDRINWRITDNPNDEINSGDPPDPNPGDDVIWLVTAPDAPDGRIPPGSQTGRPLSYEVQCYIPMEMYYIISMSEKITQDEIDQCRQEYIDMNKAHKPTRGEFVNAETYVNPGHFSFNEINSGDFSWAIFTIAQHLENIRAAIGNQDMPVASGYRNPIHNANIRPPGRPESRHQYGDAADIGLCDWNNDGEINQGDWKYMRIRARAEGASYIEPFEDTPTWIHMDWRPQ